MVFSYSYVLFQLVKRDLQSRYVGHALGFVWAFLQPLLQLGLFSFIFTVIIPISLAGEREKNFALFLFAGLLPWMIVSEVLTRGSTLIADYAPMLTKVSIPPLVFFLSLLFSALIHTSMALAVFLIVLAILGKATLWWFLLPLLLLVAGFFSSIPALLVAGLFPFFKDIKELLSYALMVWFYLSPIIYPLSLVPSAYRSWISLNPLTHVIVLFRSVLLQGEGGPLHAWLVVLAVVIFGNFLAVPLFLKLSKEGLDYV